MALVVKNPAANSGEEILVRSLGGEVPLEEGIATHSSILAWRIPRGGPWWAVVHQVTKSGMLSHV